MANDAAHPSTLAELRNSLLTRMRANTGTTQQNTADSFLNTALQDLHTGKGSDFPWAIREDTIITHAPYTTGTVTIDVSSSRTAVTGSSTLWNTAVSGFGFNNARAGGKMTFSGMTEVYEVSAVGSDTSITLKTNYTGDDITSGSYTYFEDTYSLASDFYRPADLRYFSGPADLPLVGRTEFNRFIPRNDTPGKPQFATWIQQAFSGSVNPQHRIVIYPPPDDEYSIPYLYYTTFLAVASDGTEQEQMSADTDEPIIPVRARHVLIEYAAELWYSEDKDDTVRADRARQKYVDLLSRLAGDVAIGQDRPRFVPNVRRGLPQRGRYDLNGRFDQLRW